MYTIILGFSSELCLQRHDFTRTRPEQNLPLDDLFVSTKVESHLGIQIRRSILIVPRYGLSRLGSSLSVLDFLLLGSSLSLRTFGRVGAHISVYGMTRIGSSMSVLDYVCLGSMLSLRSFGRLSAQVSILDMLVRPTPAPHSIVTSRCF